MRPPLTKTFKGSQKNATDESTKSPQLKKFEPLTISLGGSFTAFPWTAGLEIQRQNWAAGKSVVRDGISLDLPDADLKDVTNISVTGGTKLKVGPEIEFGYAYLPSPWGKGHDDGLVDHHVHGVDFGQLDGIDRQVFSAGTSLIWKKSEIKGNVFYSTGSRVVGGAGDNIGYYRLSVVSLSGSFQKSF